MPSLKAGRASGRRVSIFIRALCAIVALPRKVCLWPGAEVAASNCLYPKFLPCEQFREVDLLEGNIPHVHESRHPGVEKTMADNRTSPMRPTFADTTPPGAGEPGGLRTTMHGIGWCQSPVGPKVPHSAGPVKRVVIFLLLASRRAAPPPALPQDAPEGHHEKEGHGRQPDHDTDSQPDQRRPGEQPADEGGPHQGQCGPKPTLDSHRSALPSLTTSLECRTGTTPSGHFGRPSPLTVADRPSFPVRKAL